MSTEWYVHRNDSRLGPFTSHQLLQMVKQGTLTPNDLLWREGLKKPVRARKVQGLFALAPPVSPLSATAMKHVSSTQKVAPPPLPLDAAQQAPDRHSNLAVAQQHVTPPPVPCSVPPDLPSDTVSLSASSTSKTMRLTAICVVVGGAVLVGWQWYQAANEGSELAAIEKNREATITRQLQVSSELGARIIGSSNEQVPNGSRYRLGQPFQLGDYKYTITNVAKRWSIGTQVLGTFVGERASPNAKFVVVTYLIENCTDTSQTVLTDDFKLVDAQGRTFSPSAKANVALLQESREKDFLISELQPGVVCQMMQGFEVPDSSFQSDLTLVIPKKGFWSRGEVSISVRVD